MSIAKINRLTSNPVEAMCKNTDAAQNYYDAAQEYLRDKNSAKWSEVKTMCGIDSNAPEPWEGITLTDARKVYQLNCIKKTGCAKLVAFATKIFGNITTYTDKQLKQELERRGYVGRLRKKIVQEIEL